MNKNSNVKNLALSALFASLVFLATAYLLHIPIGNGYIHLGDTFIYLAACILPGAYAIPACAIGAGLADVTTGAAIWLVPTLIIKALMALTFFKKSNKIINTQNIVFALIASVVGLFGYVLAEIILFGNPIAAFAGILTGAIQPIGSFICFITIGKAMDKMNILERIKTING